MPNSISNHILLLASCAVILGNTAFAEELFHFKFDEGSGGTIVNTAGTLSGNLGTVAIDPANDTVAIETDSPSGQSGDGSFSNLGNGFLIANDTTRVLDITNGPITMEAWVKINGAFAKPNEGIVAYGNSYKMGLKGGRQVFTLFGLGDITNAAAGFIPIDQWVHLAAVWTPGTGVDFYVNGNQNFVANTNLRARPLTHTYLSMGSEGVNNTLIASFDRIKIHKAILSGAELDTEAGNPKAVNGNTIVSYDFNGTSFPATNSLSPSLPASLANDTIALITGRPLWTSGPTGVAGDTALAFFGTNRASVSDPTPLIVTNSLNGDYTIETWAKLPLNYAPAARAIMFQYTGIPGFAFSINTDRTLHTTTFGKLDRTSTALVPNDGAWHHFAVVHRDGVAFEFYIDGALIQTIAYTLGVGVNQTAKVITFGMAASGANVFTGTLDRIRFSNEALTQAQFDFPAVGGFPFFSVALTNKTVVVTESTTFNVTAFGASPLALQWQFSPTSTPGTATNLPGQTSPSLMINNAQLANDGYYSIIASNHVGSVTSAVARLTVTTAPVVTASLTNLFLVVGDTAQFSVAATPAPGFEALTFRWYYGGVGNPTPKTLIPEQTGPNLTLNNVQLTDQGFYSVSVSNSGGVFTSEAKLTITAPGTLTRLWEILPGERDYITPRGTGAGTTDLERGMAYNRTTDHLLIGARFVSQAAIKGIFIIRASDGVHVGELPNSAIVTGGTIYLTRVVAAEDGAIYACNFGSLSDTVPLKIYRWASETAEPTIAYVGNPVSGSGLPNQQWGKNMTVRGSGANTQILMDNRNFLALFTTTDGASFTPALIVPNGVADDWNDGLSWGNNGTNLWGKSDGRPLQQWGYTAPATNAVLLRSYSGFPSSTFGNFSFSEDHRYMAGLTVQAGPDAVELYDVSDLNRGPMLVDIGLFTPDNAQTVGYGNVYMASNRVFALNPNNGLVAFSVNLPESAPVLGIRSDNGSLVVFWPSSVTGYHLEATSTLVPADWQTVPHTVQGNENQAIIQPTGGSRFLRLAK